MLPCQTTSENLTAHYYLPAGKMTMFAQFIVQGLKEHSVGDFANIHTSIVQDCNDAFVLLLHKVHNDLVVEVINLQDKQESNAQENANPDGQDTGVSFRFTDLCNTPMSKRQTAGVRSSATMSTHFNRGFSLTVCILLLPWRRHQDDHGLRQMWLILVWVLPVSQSYTQSHSFSLWVPNLLAINHETVSTKC